uniref:Caspase family p20 domain-containing protein n=1 Tax=Meloidogyne enterolobii TaxID=390850 RepID=A0A6V7U9M2_MELEN|nr:unnamed protein product [Meloidogyne enterolobii]
MRTLFVDKFLKKHGCCFFNLIIFRFVCSLYYLNSIYKPSLFLLQTCRGTFKNILKNFFCRFSSLLFDSLLGIVIINLIPTEWKLIENFWKIVFLSIEQLENVINWLTQNPAGLKLNDALNTFLSNFFLYHIHLWKCKEQHI